MTKNKKLASKFGPLLKERWAKISGIEMEDDPVPALVIRLEDVTQKDLRGIADELVSSGYARRAVVEDAAITLIDYDMLLGDVDTVTDIVSQLLQELNYKLLNEREGA